MEDSWEAHCGDSEDMWVWSFGSVTAGARRERVCTVETDGRERRVLRISEPCEDVSTLFWVVEELLLTSGWLLTTRPVEPTTAVEVIVCGQLIFVEGCKMFNVIQEM